jgi:ATP-dependent DNA ligase
LRRQDVEPCPADGPDWLHEIKYDGYRLRVERDGDRVRLITKGGDNWSDRYPWIVEAALKCGRSDLCWMVKPSSWVLMALSDFDALHSRKHDDELQFCGRIGNVAFRPDLSPYSDAEGMSLLRRAHQARGYRL